MTIARRFLRAVERSPLRPAGVVLLVAGYFVAIKVGQGQADYLLYPAGLVAIALVGICLVSVIIAALALRRRVRRSPAGLPDSLETNVPTQTSFQFSRLRAWPIVEVTMRWDDPADVTVELAPAGGVFHETVTAHERGRHARVARRFNVHDVFGLCAFSFRVVWNEPLRIAPLIAAAGAELPASHSEGDSFSHPAGRAIGDLVEMRAYGHGDPMRHVLWKTFARTRRMLVRMPERALAPRPITVAALVAGAGDEPAAAVARYYVEKGLLGPDFVFAADGANTPTAKPHEAVDQIIDSVRARARGGEALDALATQVERSRLAACVIFVPSRSGAWREHVSAFSRGLPAPPTVVIAIEGEPGEKRGLLRKLLLRGSDGNGVTDVSRLRQELEAEGLRVQVVHRQTGQVA